MKLVDSSDKSAHRRRLGGGSQDTNAGNEEEDAVVERESTTTTTTIDHIALSKDSWVRGVNLGGWLLMEKYLTPYQFAVTTCHLKGDFCWYPGQINAPPNATLCDLKQCKPVLERSVLGTLDYPMDEYTLWRAFGENTTYAEEWLNSHLEYFITEADIRAVKDSGATHVRVPLAHWILESQQDLTASGEMWIVGKRWDAFQRLVGWARKHNLFVWPDIHTAPGSQNGFDNSGRLNEYPTCRPWIESPDNMLQSLKVIRAVTEKIVQDNMDDVVTGFGLINEPFKDCDHGLYTDFIERGFNIVRETLGPNAFVYVSDIFMAETFNDGKWWLDPEKYSRTFIDTHFYQVFAEPMRALSPRQHIALACREPVQVCCWEDAPQNTIPSNGVKHMIGEWSAAVDTSPREMLEAIMDNIAKTGVALHLDREIPPDRQAFLRNYVEAQQVTYEMQELGNGGAWFFWNVKVEGGAFAEWDFLRGIREGWIPRIPIPHVSSESLYGSCYEIMARTPDNSSILHEYPKFHGDPGWQLSDDVVVSHGESVLNPAKTSIPENGGWEDHTSSVLQLWGAAGVILIVCLVGFIITGWRLARCVPSRKLGYTSLPESATPEQ